MIDHDRKLKEFMSKKDQERTEAHEYIEEMKAKKETEKMNERETTVQVCIMLVYVLYTSLAVCTTLHSLTKKLLKEFKKQPVLS